MLNPEEFDLKKASQIEIKRFEKLFTWIKDNMPEKLFREVDRNTLILITHNLINFDIQGFFSIIHVKNRAIVFCLDGPKADQRILKEFPDHGIRYYRSYTSKGLLPFDNIKEKLRIGFLHFTEGADLKDELASKKVEKLSHLIKERNPDIDNEEFKMILQGMHSRFVTSMSEDRLLIAVNMFFKAKRDDACQIDITKVENYKEIGSPSLKIMLAWKNTPKRNFLYRVAQTAQRHNLNMTRFTATYIDPFSTSNILIMSIGVDGPNGSPAWEKTNLEDFFLELTTLKIFEDDDIFEKEYVENNRITSHQAHFLRTAKNFVHQVLTHLDPNQYTCEQIEKDLCKHPNITLLLLEAFEQKFHPDKFDEKSLKETLEKFQLAIQKLDTGQPFHDQRKRNVLRVGMNFVEFCLKTNFFERHKTAFGFRMDPNYLNYTPYDRKEIFAEVPYGIFFIVGMHYIGFHIRFKDLSRGGLRTVISRELDQLTIEKNQTFSECYNLAYTQQKKNKDIPEGGAKGVILLDPFEQVKGDSELLEREMQQANIDKSIITDKIQAYKEKMKLEFLYSSQKSYVATLLVLVNCDEHGVLRAEKILNYWKKPEYIYLGPDENMHNNMIEWIAEYSSYVGYVVGKSFISSKPSLGINHKEYGVTSFGVNVYMQQALLYLGIDPKKDSFTVKISGGPDGDVAGNQIKNLHRFYKDTAKVIAITDVSGTIYDPKGLDLNQLVGLFNEAKSIRHYPPELLNDEGFLLDLQAKKTEKPYSKLTLCYRKKEGKLIEDYISGNEMNHIFRMNVHQAKTDIFIPAGGRPRTLNIDNYQDFLDENNNPSSKAIVEGANLYLTPTARRKLEELGVIILKDSSCNKGGVMTSSMEVITSLVLTNEEFIENKEKIVKEILNFIRDSCQSEAELLLSTHKKTGEYLTDLSDKVSMKINKYKYEILSFLETIELSDNPNDPYIKALLLHCPAYLRHNHPHQILKNIPEIHKKAIIAAYIASHLVYDRGISWSPSIVDILPIISKDKKILDL